MTASRRTRARHARGTALALAVCLAGCSVGGTSTETTTTPSPRTYALSKPCPAVQRMLPVSAEIANTVVARSNLPAWQAADIGASTKLSDNRMVWVFGDTIRDDSHQPKIVANSMLLSAGLCVNQLTAPAGGPIIPDISEKVVYWPMSVARLDPRKVTAPGFKQTSGDLLVILAGRIRRGAGAFDFTYLGSSAAVFTVQPGQAPQLLTVEEITPDTPSVTQVNWGSAALVDGPWYYVYGSRTTGKKYEFGRELYVARAPVARPADRREWRFWDGSAWQPAQGRARPVLPAKEGVSQTLSVSRTRGKFVVVSKKGGDLGDFVYTWSSPAPTGPWLSRRGVAAPFGVEKGQLQYAPLGHPEIPLASGRLLVSISRNTTDLSQLLQRPTQVGRPVFTEVQLPAS